MTYQRNIIIIGKTGTGKSSLANTLLGRDAFPTGFGPNAVTQECEGRENRNVLVIDTPGLFSVSDNVAYRARRIQSALDRCSTPHAFLIVFRLGRVTEEDRLTLNFLKLAFGPEYLKHTIVVFTNVTIAKDDNDFVVYCHANDFLKNTLKTFGNRVARIDNTENYDKRVHITKIFSLVDSVSNNGSRTFQFHNRGLICKILQEAAARYTNESADEQIHHILEIQDRVFKMQRWKDFAIKVGIIILGSCLAYLVNLQRNKTLGVPPPKPPPSTPTVPSTSASPVSQLPSSSLSLPQASRQLDLLSKTRNNRGIGAMTHLFDIYNAFSQLGSQTAFSPYGQISRTTGADILNAQLLKAEIFTKMLCYIIILMAKQRDKI